MKKKGLLFCTFVVSVLGLCAGALAQLAPPKAEVTNTQPNGVKYARQPWADSTLSGGRPHNLPGSGVAIKLPGPCDFNPKLCEPPTDGGGGTGVVIPPAAKKSFSHTFSGKWSNGSSIGNLNELTTFALPDAPDSSKAQVTIDSLTKLSGCGGFDPSTASAIWWPTDYTNMEGPGAWGGMMTAPLYACPARSDYSYRVNYTVTYP